MKLNLTTFLFSIPIIITITTNKKYSATASADLIHYATFYESADLITATCMKTINPQRCEHVLRSFPEVARGNLHSLGEFSIHYATFYARTTVDMFESFLARPYTKETDRDNDIACRDMYSSARTSLTEAGNHFLQNEYERAKALAGNAYRVPDQCQHFFADDQSTKGKRMKKSNEQAKDIFNIPFTIARELHQPGGHQY